MSKLCETTTGLCVPESTIAYASPTGTNTATCTLADPCSVGRAFAITDANRSTVLMAPGSYAANIVVANKTVHVRGADATITSDTGTTLTINDDGKVDAHGVTIISSATGGNAVLCESLNGTSTPSITMEDGRVESPFNGISLKHGRAMITRSKLHTTGGNIIIGILGSTADIDHSTGISSYGYVVAAGDNSLITFTNSVLVGNSSSGNDDCCFANVAGITFSFSTLVNLKASCTNSVASCTGATHNGVCFDSSIIANFSPGAPTSTMQGQSCVATYSLVFPQATAVSGPGNKINVNPSFVNAANGDYHLQGTSPAIDGANPTSTLMDDIEGKSRPQGAQRDMGAYEYP